jgi:hypothetical protein
MSGSAGVFAAPLMLARERGKPMSKPIVTLALNDLEVAELKAHHLACSHLVRGCQDAVFRFREAAAGGDTDASRLAHRTVEILEDVLASWCETVSMLRSALDHASSQGMRREASTQSDANALGTGLSGAKTPVDSSTVFVGSP